MQVVTPVRTPAASSRLLLRRSCHWTMQTTDSSAKALLSTWWFTIGHIVPKYTLTKRRGGRIWYLAHTLRDRKYIARSVPRDVTKSQLRATRKVSPNNLNMAASQ